MTANSGVFVGPCCRCKSEMWLPQMLHDTAKHSSKISFYCPYGHEQIFADGESETEKLRHERDRLKQENAYLHERAETAVKAEREAQKAIKNLREQRRIARQKEIAGVCPCCHRTFRQMALHMKNKHPDFRAEEAA